MHVYNQSTGSPKSASLFDVRFTQACEQLCREEMSSKSVLEAAAASHVSINEPYESDESTEMAVTEKPLGKFNKALFSLVSG